MDEFCENIGGVILFLFLLWGIVIAPILILEMKDDADYTDCVFELEQNADACFDIFLKDSFK